MSAATLGATGVLTREHGLELLAGMLRIRRFEERCVELYSATKIRGFLHLYIGEEAIAVGVLRALRAADAVVATYREHGHALARGIPMRSLMAEMYGRREGCCHGRGGSMHIFDASARFFGGNAIVGGGLPLAVGLGLAAKLRGTDSVTVCFFGEGAVAEGEFHESLNLAELWRLPVLFACENNLYAMGTALERSESETRVARKAESYRVPAATIDGMDVLAVEAAAAGAVSAIRAGSGPQLLELLTYRFRAHSMFDPELYRDKAEVERWKQRDPIGALEDRLATRRATRGLRRRRARGKDPRRARGRRRVRRTRHAPADRRAHDRRLHAAGRPVSANAVRTTYREALRAGLRDALRGDPRAFLLGEDVGRYGGCYAVSKGLLDEFGPERVRDTPLSESAFVGAAIGAALDGLKPIVEIMTVNFSLLCLDQIVNNAATIRHMSGGQLSVPVVIRMATGAGRQLAAQHSHSLENWYAHVPGLRVIAPATLDDARWMLAAAVADPDPVVVFEHVLLYNVEGELDPTIRSVDIDSATIRRTGRDITLVTYGGSLPKTLAAAETLAAEGIEAEVVDLRTLRPLDEDTVLGSVRKTRRVVVVDEGWRSGSLAGEVIARIAEAAFYDLDAPPARVCSVEVPIPYAKHLEDAALPQPAQIVAAARGLLGS